MLNDRPSIPVEFHRWSLVILHSVYGENNIKREPSERCPRQMETGTVPTVCERDCVGCSHGEGFCGLGTRAWLKVRGEEA